MPDKIEEIVDILAELETECDELEHRIEQERAQPSATSLLPHFERILGNQRGMIDNLKQLVEKYRKK